MVKFVDLDAPKVTALVRTFPLVTLIAFHVVIFYFCNKAQTLLIPWGRVSCTCMAASVAMVIYAHLPHLNKPLHGGSHWDSLETENSAMESQLTAAPKMSIVT